jgi:hypothetical protein
MYGPVLFLRNEAGKGHTVHPPLTRDFVSAHHCFSSIIQLQALALAVQWHTTSLIFFAPVRATADAWETHPLQYRVLTPSLAARVLLALLVRAVAANKIRLSAQIPPYRVVRTPLLLVIWPVKCKRTRLIRPQALN